MDDDLVDLRRLWGSLKAKCRLDLCNLAATAGVGNEFRHRPLGLKRLTNVIAGLDLPKPKSVAKSDWSKVPLSNRQLEYCAWDAWAAAAIAEELACLDEDAFAASSLTEKLRRQPSIKKLESVRRERQRIRKALTRIKDDHSTPRRRFSEKTRKHMANLKLLLKDKRPPSTVILVEPWVLGVKETAGNCSIA